MKIQHLITAALTMLISSCSEKAEFDASGNFEATEVTLSAESSGKILSFDVEEGDTVEIGELLAKIDTVQLQLQKEQLIRQRSASNANIPDISVQLSSYRTELDKQLREKRRIENLLADGAATTKQLDDINSAIKMIEDKISAQQSILSNNSASIRESASAIDVQIRQIDSRLDDCMLRSPLKGTALTKYCEAGEYTVTGKPMLKIANIERMYLRAYFTSAQLANLKLGQRVKVLADFGGDNVYEYPGTVTWISAESEFTPKNIQTQDSRSNLVYAVKIAVKNDGRLKIGGFGEVKL